MLQNERTTAAPGLTSDALTVESVFSLDPYSGAVDRVDNGSPPNTAVNRDLAQTAAT
jgi:hypothetical protein